jgi:hypothetical protein
MIRPPGYDVLFLFNYLVNFLFHSKLALMRSIFLLLFLLAALSSHAQTPVPMQVPSKAIGQLEDLKELTKKTAVTKQKRPGKQPAETNPELNRYLVIAADDFVRVTTDNPTREAYIACIDKGLARMAPLATTTVLRQQVADYYLDLMEIVGLGSSDGKLDSFVSQAASKQ